MSILHAVTRPLLAAPLIVSGAGALVCPKAHCKRAQRLAPVASKFSVELDETMSDSAIRSLGAVFAVIGVALVANKFPRAAGVVPAAMQVSVAPANNPVRSGKGKDRKECLTELTGLLGAAGLVGDALLAAADRDGRPSLSRRRQTNCRHRETLRATWVDRVQ